MKESKEAKSTNVTTNNYDFKELVEACPDLKQYVKDNGYGEMSIDFFNPDAVKILNKSMLMAYHNIEYWDIPKGALAPAIPGRESYLEHIVELLDGKKEGVRILDIGVGANCIYPILGCSKFGWSFVGSDISRASIENAQKIVKRNKILRGKVDLRLQQFHNYILKGIIKDSEYFDIMICNPPFHSSDEEAKKANLRKLRNLKETKEVKKSWDIKKPSLNFGGEHNELWCDGGELRFITRMIREGRAFNKQCGWFTSLVSKEANLKPIFKELDIVKVAEYGVIEMKKGNKSSRIVVWRY